MSLERAEEFIKTHKGILLALGTALVAGVGIWGYRHHSRNGTLDRQADEIYAFETGTFKKYGEEKISPAEFVAELGRLRETLGDAPGFYPALPAYADELRRQGRPEEALALLSWGREYPLPPRLRHLFLIRVAAIHEDADRPGEAVKALLELTDSGKDPPLAGKLYLDLGRLYRQLGNSEKAKASFQYVLDHSDDAGLLKLARLYLKESGT